MASHVAIHAVLLMTLAAPVPKTEPVYYYPTVVGDTWVVSGKNGVFRYQVTEAETNGEVITVTEKRGHVLAITAKQYTYSKYSVSPTGIRLIWADDRRVEPPELLMKLPPKAGEVWGGKKKERTGIPVEVTVKAGKFLTFPVVTTEVDEPGETATFTIWYAPRVGFVRSAYAVNGVETRTFELIEFTTGTAAKK